ncbi:hypothetical protein KP509_11G082900 [Ceratopteris richardii]|uniref:Carboxypeptidase n=1 Tax=Ceratopteris richardii TaxID=49495 RepID=A0A8T2U054_CERRI|nr:hypothetical protein KP509_11G082900 [Ceratopteris richardii]
MARLLLSFIFVTFAYVLHDGRLIAQAAPSSQLIEHLPGQPDVGFKQYSGYVTVNASAGRALFYYFAEVDANPFHKHHATDYPVTLWLNGGPGCSSIGGGAFTELGPFFPRSDGRGLRKNKYSWNKVTNIIFLESPAGVGWSYSNTTTDYTSFGDAKTAEDSLAFLLGWLQLFPEYKENDFYITGESYAGHYVPQLASLMLSYKGPDGFKFNLKGIAIGNPLLQLAVDAASTYDYLWSHGIISDLVYDDIVSHCNFEDYTLSSPNVCYPSLVQQELLLRKKVAHISNGVDVCITSERTFYFNMPEVQQALHANFTTLGYPWSMCSGVLQYHLEDANIDMLPSLRALHIQGIRILIFSGDQDSVVPFIGTRSLVRQLAGSLRLRASVPYSAWYDRRQVGGWTVQYGKNLTFATVRGAAHMVPYSQPSRALTMFRNFLGGRKLPTQ